VDTFTATERRQLMTDAKLYCSVSEAQVCEQLTQSGSPAVS